MLKLQLGTGELKIFQTDDEAYGEILDGLAASERAMVPDAVKWHFKWIKHKAIITPVLREWVNSSDYFLIRLLSGQARESKTYSSFMSIARAVLGEAKSRPNLVIESSLADDAMNNGFIGQNLSSLMTKIYTKMRDPSTIWRRPCPELTNHHGAYWLIAYKTYDFRTVLADPPATIDLTLKVAVLHDLMDILKDYGPLAATVVPDPRQNCSVLGAKIGPKSYDVIRIGLGATDTFRRKDDSTLLETDEFIASARKKKMPLSCGPSYTTGRLMQMAHWAGANNAEKTAMAWGIFSFWNRDYFTSVSGVHRFHEVMDMSRNYGVPYTPFDYPVASPIA